MQFAPRRLRTLTDRLARPAAPETPLPSAVDRRVVIISGLAVLVALGASAAARLLTWLIGLITNVSFYGRWSAELSSPADNKLGLAVIAVPVVGGIIVGIMARYGSRAIRGHGIPEAMEQVLFNESKIPARLVLLKPISAAIAIGTGGPFGAEGPIIATGGALGSLVGQVISVTADERKTLLAAGAAAGMAATFGTPVSGVLLAIELLLFEYRARSAIPVAFATCTATAMRMAQVGTAPVFAMPDMVEPSAAALAIYIVIGGLMGAIAAGVSRSVYIVEDAFEHLPVHWMFWPAIGAVFVGVIGYFSPHTLGVGYDNIDRLLGGTLAGRAALIFCVFKFVSWGMSLGSGTSGGTLAPLFTIGGGLGSAMGTAIIATAPGLGVDVRIAALVGMAAMFAGASRAFLASVVFAFECTRQPLSLLPLLGGGSAAVLVSSMLTPTSIMTEKIIRRGARVLTEYAADFLDSVLVKDHAARELIVLPADETVEATCTFLRSSEKGARHTGFPVVDKDGKLVGVVTREEVLEGGHQGSEPLRAVMKRPPLWVYEDASLRQAADRMVTEGVGRLVVVKRDNPSLPTGMVTRSDILGAHRARLEGSRKAKVHVALLKRRTVRSP